MTAVTDVLTVDDAKVWFGGVRAVDGVTLRIEPGKLYGLVGPNGSGKTTLINAISGQTALTGGRIAFAGRDIASIATDRLSRAGIARTFQAIKLVPRLTVRENVLLGADRVQRPRGAASGASGWRARRALRRAAQHDVDEILERLDLGPLARQHPEGLPYGTQRRVEIARALASRPRLLLLDEPIAGMSGQERDEIAAVIRRLREDGLTQVLIEHDLQMILRNCDHLFVLNFGRCVAEGPPEETARLPIVQEAYLGRRDAGA